MLANILYPLKPPHRTRDAAKPMQVLALGLVRSGTDSLRTAFLMLGYETVWHGWEMPLTRANEAAIWVPLQQAKYDGEQVDYDWDEHLGDCEVLMDMPPAVFAKELLDYYPEAKVILNRRKDIDAWHESVSKAADILFGGWTFWTLTWFDTELFWYYRQLVLSLKFLCKGGTFRQNGKQAAIEHYERIEAKLQRDGREYLDWEVQDGWGPLCDFLGKEAPTEEFPWVNRGGDEFQKKADKATERMVKRAAVKLAMCTAGIAIGVAYLWRR